MSEVPVTADPGETAADGECRDGRPHPRRQGRRGRRPARAPRPVAGPVLPGLVAAGSAAATAASCPWSWAIVVVAIGFQIANSKFLSAQNLVNLFEQSTVYMLLAMAEIFALLLGEIDLSVGLVMGLGSVVVAELVQPGGANWPWWAAIIVTLLALRRVRRHPGNARGPAEDAVVHRHPRRAADPGGRGDHRPRRVARRHRQLPVHQRGASSTTSSGGRSARWSAGSCSPWWSEPPARGLWLQDARKRRRGLEAPPRSLTALKIVLMAVGGHRARRHLQRQPGPRRDDRGSSLHHPDRPGRARRLDGPAAANPLRPLRLRHRRQPRGGAASRRQPARDPDLVLRARRA